MPDCLRELRSLSVYGEEDVTGTLIEQCFHIDELE
jgi:hypothetical protein